MKTIGYNIIDISVSINPYLTVAHAGIDNQLPVYRICVKEKNSTARIFQADMSQGMFRALSLIIQFSYNILKKLSTTILIDDIGEGLDFDRSAKLIQLLINIAENSNIQLIMSTNDRYVMNKVPFKYWQVIDRKGGVCKVFNYENSKSIFDDFEYTGLNNFDFLAYDYINSKWETE
jgi:hypothetical protein